MGDDPSDDDLGRDGADPSKQMHLRAGGGGTLTVGSSKKVTGPLGVKAAATATVTATTVGGHPVSVGRYEFYHFAGGGTPIYHVKTDKILFPTQKPFPGDFQKALDAYATTYRAQRRKWWGWKKEYTVPYQGMKDKSFTFAKGAWVDLGPRAWFGAGACADWAQAIGNGLPSTNFSYQNDTYQVYCRSFPGQHVSRHIHIGFTPQQSKSSNPLFKDREKYVVMLDPWVTGCACIYSLAGWKTEIKFSKEKQPGMWV